MSEVTVFDRKLLRNLEYLYNNFGVNERQVFAEGVRFAIMLRESEVSDSRYFVRRSPIREEAVASLFLHELVLLEDIPLDDDVDGLTIEIGQAGNNIADLAHQYKTTTRNITHAIVRATSNALIEVASNSGYSYAFITQSGEQAFGRLPHIMLAKR
ncbi:MAG TPA: hypothetical protein VHE53_03130 [Patescibacteria group bacterium]|nr:hypothetical protein [Patescibacteria group bacterium]